MEPSSGREVNGPSTPVSRPADAAASLVATPVPLNGVPPDGDEPASPVPALHASACAETTPLRKRAADDVNVSPAKVPRAGGPEALAAELHARHMYDAACVLELFEMLPRAEVTRHSQSKGSVFAGGSYSHGPIKGLRHFTKEFPNVFRYLCACILHVLPTHKFSSLLISDSVESEPHSDPNNGPTLNLLVPLTNFTGGSLLLGETCELDFKLGAWAFNARDCPHSVLPFEGRRVMLIAYSTKDVWNSSADDLSVLRNCGFVLPDSGTVMPSSPQGPLPDLRAPVHSTDVTEPLKPLKPVQVVVLDLFCGRGLVGRACAELGFKSLCYASQCDGPARHKVLPLCASRPSSWHFLRRLVMAHRVFHVHVCLADYLSAEGLDHLAAFVAHTRQLNIGLTVCGPSTHAGWRRIPFSSSLHTYNGPGCVLKATCSMLRVSSTLPASADPRPCACSQPVTAFALTKHYATAFAESLRMQAATEGLLISPQSALPALNPSVHKQSKLSKMQPIMPEFRYMVTLPVSDCSSLQLDDKRCLKFPFQSAPEGSRLLRLAFPGGGSLKPKALSPLPPTPATATFGVFRTPDEFLAASLCLEHPFDSFAHVPDGLLRNLGRVLIDGPLPVMRHRVDLLARWTSWANELAEQEKSLHASLDPRVEAVISGKKLLLLDRIARSMDWPDVHLLDDLKQGFSLVGSAPVTGVFEPSFKPAEFTEEELDKRAKFLRPALWAKIASASPEETDAELWRKTLEERDQKSWLSGPYTYDELTDILGPHWIPVRRFGIYQKGKLRCIDDLSENSINSSWEVAEKVDLKAMDELLWIVSRLMQAIADKGAVNLVLSSGEMVSGPLHTVWRTKPESARPLLKCIDLESAYKQFAIRPADSKRCVVSLKRPSDGEAVGFISHTLPFGSLASVGQFNRVSRLIHRILVELRCLVCNYYDDYPVLEVSMLASNTEKTIRKLMRLLGFSCSEDKELPFSTVYDLLGVRLDLRSKDFSCVLVANKPDRAREISESVAQVLASGQVVAREVDSLFGRIQYADSQIMGRRGKLALSTLRNLGRGSGAHRLTDSDRDAFAVLKSRMESGEPRCIQVGQRGPSLVVFTDGACEPGASDRPACTVGGILYARWNGATKVRFFGATLSDSVVDRWMASGKKHLIGLVELYAVVLARFVWGDFLDNRRAMFFIDHVGVLSALIKCSSRDELWRSLLVSLEKADAVPCIGWYARVPSQSNPSDPPSRGLWSFPMCEQAIRDSPSCFLTNELLRSS